MAAAASLVGPVEANAQTGATTPTKDAGKKNQNDDKVRTASSGKLVLKDQFCPEPKPGQAILMNCQKAKINRAKLAKKGKGAGNASTTDSKK